VRNLGLIVALWLSVLLPTNSLALGLGEIEVNSFLNQPLNAEIKVISARPGEIDDLLVSLASREAFTRAGLARPRHLTDLRFTVKKNEAGDEATILVTTKAGVKEPFLNFLIEADWSKGRVLREFTILLDPPFFADQPAPVETTQAAAEPEEQPIAEEASVSEIVEQAGVTISEEAEPSEPADSGAEITEPIALSEDVAEAEPATEEYVAPQPANIIDGDVMVAKGDTLWSIASRYKDDTHSMAQVMLAFQRANPDAFTDGNINNMKEGAILRAPSMDEIDGVGQQEAYAEVLRQNGLWDEYVARVTGVSPAVASEESAGEMAVMEEAPAEESGELSLLMPEEGESESTGIGESGDVDELRTKLALAEEELDAARIENQELESRITELQARLSKVEELQKMVEIEDDSLAQLQAEQSAEPVDEADEGIEQIEESTQDIVEQATQADEEALLEELLAEEAAAQAEEQAALQGGDDQMASDETASDDQMAEDAMTDDAMTDDTMTDEAASADEASEAQAVTPPPAPVVVAPPVIREPSIFDGILPPDVIDMIPSMSNLGGLFGDPIILSAIGGVVVLLLGLVFLKRRRAADDDESGITVSGGEDLFANEEDEELTPIHLADGGEPEETDIKVPTEEDIAETAAAAEPAVEAGEDLAATAGVSAEDMPESEAPAAASPEQDDVLNEVDVYLAYGLYDNAEELLTTNLAEFPERADYRSKLLDTYFATKNTDAFVKEAQSLKSMGEVAARYWDRVQIMGYELAPDNALFSDAKDSGLSAADLEITKPQEADFDLGASEDDDTNFSTTDFNLGEEDTGGDFNDTANLGEAGEIAATQQIPQIDELPDLPDLAEDDSTNVPEQTAAETELELPDDIGDELEFSMNDEATGADETGLELPEEPATGDVDMDELAMEFDIDAEEAAAVDDSSEVDIGAEFDAALEQADGLELDDAGGITFDESLGEVDKSEIETDEDALELGISDEDEGQTETAIITPNYEDTEVVPQFDQEEAGEDDSEIDLGMEDTAMMDSTDETSLATSELNLDTGELRLPVDEEEIDDEDISIIDFGGEDFVEPTDVIESIDDEDDSLVEEEDAQDVRTGTFAPGDFEEPTEATESVADIDDIGELMLPDDVDEVSTKLDLARAFIDMGDTEGARGSLEEVMSEGNEEQKAEAKALLDQI